MLFYLRGHSPRPGGFLLASEKNWKGQRGKRGGKEKEEQVWA
jgi:hypothetical protein